MYSKNKMKWQAFLKYSKAHPDYIPKDVRGRSIIYQECKAGRRSDLCDAIKSNKLMTKPYNPSTDMHLLQARITACEEEMQRLQVRARARSGSRRSRNASGRVTV